MRWIWLPALVLMTSACGPSDQLQKGAITWTTRLDKALALAKEKNQLIAMHFWATW